MRHPVVLLALALPAGGAAAQFPPDSLTNLQVLDTSMTPREVVNLMRGFAIGLGVRCEYCHVGEPGEPLSTFDFASDERPPKEKARAMLRMVQAINGEWLSELADRGTPAVDVQCATCHRGQARPVMMEDLLVHVADSAGADAAAARYTELRERFYGGDTYDFRAGAVNDAATSLLRAGDPAGAKVLLGVNGAYGQEDFTTHALLGQADLALGDTAAAIAQLERAAELQPNHPVIRRLLTQLKSGQ